MRLRLSRLAFDIPGRMSDAATHATRQRVLQVPRNGDDHLGALTQPRFGQPHVAFPLSRRPNRCDGLIDFCSHRFELFPLGADGA